jgi:hypothetical protein
MAVGESEQAYHMAMSSQLTSGMLRFAVLWHSGIEEPHFDFMVETRPGSDLATWRVGSWPIMQSTEAKRLKDHRRMFLDYQGQLSGHRGQVEKVAGGACRVEIGPDAVWRVSGVYRTDLVLRQISGDVWMASVD